MRKWFVFTCLSIMSIVLSADSASAQVAKTVRVDVSAVTQSYVTLVDALTKSNITNLQHVVEQALNVLKLEPPEDATEEERQVFIQERGRLASLILAAYPQGAVLQVEMNQLVDAFFKSNTEIAITLSLRQPIVESGFTFATTREDRRRVANYVRINGTYGFGVTELVNQLVELVQKSQESAVPILNTLNDLLKQQASISQPTQ